MSKLSNDYIKLLEDKLGAIEGMLSLTQAKTFTGQAAKSEEEAESFIDLYNRRSDYIIQIEKAQQALSNLDALDFDDVEDEGFQKKVLEFNDKMRTAAKAISDLDKQNMEAYEKISAHFKGNMKQVRNNISLTNSYDGFTDTNQGYYLDKKKV